MNQLKQRSAALAVAFLMLAAGARAQAQSGALLKAKEVMPAARQHLAHAFAGGVKVAFGTDAAVYPHGLNAREFAVMVKLGLTPLQAIQGAAWSRLAAGCLGRR